MEDFEMENRFRIRNFEGINSDIIEALEDYVNEGHSVGDFLMNCLENKFVDAVCTADLTNLRAIDKIARVIWNQIPAKAWGNVENVRNWQRGEYLRYKEYRENNDKV